MVALRLAGGLLSGIGQGMVAQDDVRRKAEEKRQEALRRARERQEERDWQAQRDEANRAFQIERDEAAHQRQGGLLTGTVTGEDGELYGITRSGQSVKIGIRPSATGGGKATPPAEVQAAEWLARNTAESEGRDVTPEDRLRAHEIIRTAKDNPNQRAGLVLRVYEAAKKDLTDRRSDEEKRAAAEEFVNQLLAREQGGRGGSSGGGGAPTSRNAAQSQSRQDAASAYKSADDVKAAYQAGTLSRAEALNILRSQFGYQ